MRLALAPSYHLSVQEEEHRQMQKRLEAFDKALEDLRRAKERLAQASDLYLQRLEGTRRERGH